MKYYALNITNYYLDTVPRAAEGMNSDMYDLSLKKYWQAFVQVEDSKLIGVSPNWMQELLSHGVAPEFYYRMKYKPMDFMELGFAYSKYGFTISNKTSSLFTQEELSWYSVTNNNIWFRSVKQDQYYFIATLFSLRHFINFLKSEFYLIKSKLPNGVYELDREVIRIQNMDDLLRGLLPNYNRDSALFFTLYPKHIVLMPVIKTCPIIISYIGNTSLVIREDVLERMIKNQITGIEKVTELDWLHGDW
jgi:hypothetical protein